MVAGLDHLSERFGPVALRLQNFGAMHQTLASIGHQIGLGSAPGVELRGPFARAAEIVDASAGQDDGAIDDPRQHRRYFPRRSRDHRLIEPDDAVGDVI
jgi:hypothetical protein